MSTTMVDKNEELVTEIFNPSDMIVYIYSWLGSGSFGDLIFLFTTKMESPDFSRKCGDRYKNSRLYEKDKTQQRQ